MGAASLMVGPHYRALRRMRQMKIDDLVRSGRSLPDGIIPIDKEDIEKYGAAAFEYEKARPE